MSLIRRSLHGVLDHRFASLPKDNKIKLAAVVILLSTPGVLGLLMLVHRQTSDLDFGDVRLYFEYSRLSFGRTGNSSIVQWVHNRDAILSPDELQVFPRIQIPYRDFACEYPPLALAAFMALGLAESNYVHYVVAFRVAMSVCVLLICIVLYKILRTCGNSVPNSACNASAAFSIMVCLHGSMLTDRFDVFSSLLVGLSLLLCIRRLHLLSCVLLGLAIATKVWPLVLLPVVLISQLREQEFGGIFASTAAAILTVLFVHLPWLVVAPFNAFGYLAFLGSRGLQIESLPAYAVILVARAWHLPVKSVYEWGAYDLVSPPLDRWVSGVSTFASAILYALVLTQSYSSRRDETDGMQQIILGYVSVVLAILLTAKVFSPQYLIWLTPAIFAINLNRVWKLFALFVAACLCTKLELIFYDAVNALQIKGILLLTARNLMICLMGLFAFKAMAISVVPKE